MALKQLNFNYHLNKEKSTVTLYSDCQDTCGRVFVLEAPVEEIFCGDCSDAVLRLKDSALVVQTCEDFTTNGILGSIVNKVKLVDANGCPLPTLKITFEYNDNQLVSPDAIIDFCDIESFSCFSAADDYLRSLMLCGTTLDITVEETDPCPSGYFIGRS